jgi:hypothetical protein
MAMARTMIGGALVLACSLSIPVAGLAAAQKVSSTNVEVDGHRYKVVRYNDDTVLVAQRSISGEHYGVVLRNRMRQAVVKATGCHMVDDMLDQLYMHLVGSLQCQNIAQSSTDDAH